MKKIITILLSAMMLLTSCTQNDVNLQPKETSSISVESSELTSQSEEISMEDYLKDNAVSATEENISDMFKLIDTDRYNIFLNGEGHGTQNSYKFQFELIKYLNKNANVRYILMEAGFGSVQYLNTYLDTGNETLLDNYIINYSETPTYTNEHAQFYKNIYEYNRNLPQNKKIKLIGIDIEHSVATPIMYFQQFLPDKVPPKEIEKIIKQIKSYTMSELINKKQILDKVYNKIINDFEDNKIIYKEYLNDKFNEYAFIINNMNETINAKKQEDIKMEFEIREKQIYNNFKSCYPYLKEGKIFGQFGAAHINQVKLSDEWANYTVLVQSFTSKLIENNDIQKDTVCSMGAIYSNCLARSNDGKTLLGDISFFSLNNNVKSLNAIENDYGLIKLIGKNSPFKYDKNILQYNFDGFATDLFQYVYVLKNSPACTKYTPIKK